MIDKADQRMVAWVQSIVGKIGVSLEFPQPPARGDGVSLYLMEVLPTPALRLVREPEPLRLTLRYLVTTWAGSPVESHRMLAELMFAAMKTSGIEVETEGVPHSFWQTLAQPVRPSFVMRVPLLQPRTAKSVPTVRQPLVLKNSPLQPLLGQVLGPGEQVLMDALVELPTLNLSTRTDAQGRFCFVAVPTQPPVHLLRIHAKGRQIDFSPTRQPSSDEPLLIHLNENQL
jgi:hypothetical protein